MSKAKSAIITGSTSGIGLGIANVLADKGYNIMVNGFGDKNEINKIVEDLNKKKIKAIYSPADMSKGDEIKKMVDLCAKELGSVDVLVNNAGIQHVAHIVDFPEAKWDQILAINLSSAFHSIKAALPHMRKQNFGRIINIASAHGLVGSEGKSAYCAAKHGLLGLTKVTALETALENITCNAICPGWVLTPLVEKQIENNAKSKNISIAEASKELLAEKQPSMQFATPGEIGEMVAYLVSDAAKQVRGGTFSIDGGWTVR
jgi:3-hydroxybutyrate dehydrogenase